MKKIFSLLAALIVLSTSGVWAQNASTTTTTRKVQRIDSDATAAAELESGYYLIRVQFLNGPTENSKTWKSAYVYYSGNDVNGSTGALIRANNVSSVNTDTISSTGSLAYVWCVSHQTDISGNKRLVIQNAGNGGAFPKQNTQGGNMAVSKNMTNAATYYYSEAYADSEKSGVLLYQSNYKHSSGNSYYVHANNTSAPYNLSYWNGGSFASTACLFSFYKITLADGVETQATPVFYSKYKKVINGVDTGEEVTDYTTLVKKGDTPVSPFLFSSEFYDVTYTPTTITSSTDVVTVNFTSKTNDYCNLGTYYKLKVRGNDKSVYASGTKAQDLSVIAKKDFVMNYSPERYWQFEQEGMGVKMRCLNGKYIKVSAFESEDNDKTAVAVLVDNIADASTFYMEGKPSNSGTDKGFSLKYAANTYLGDHCNSNLGVWRHDTDASNDKGSCFVIESNLNDDYTAAKNLLTARLNMEQPSVDANMLRVATTEQIASAKTALAAATDMQGVVDAYKLAFTATPDANAFYRIVCLTKGGNRYPSSEDIVVATDGSLATYYNAASDADKSKVKRTVTRKTESDLLIPQLWKFESQSDGSYKIKNANNSCCWGGNASLIDMPISTTDGGNYRIVSLPKKEQLTSIGSSSAMTELNDGVTTFQLLLDGNVINAKAGASGTELAAYNNHDEDTGNYWQIEKIENFDVAINAAAKYATVGYPFPVQVTNNDVKVYYATEAKNGILKLTEATNNIIPANEGAILNSESGATTANMKILASTESTTFADNKLTATTAKREGFTTLTTYGLSNKDGVVCFRKNSDTNVPANKAYLDASKYTSASGSAQQLLFSFDNVVEGIDNVVKAQNANKVYYDLQGRRVLYPAHGIFVTENGEKVFIK